MKLTGKAGGQDRARALTHGPMATVIGRNRHLPDDDVMTTDGKERVAEAGLLARRRHLSMRATGPW